MVLTDRKYYKFISILEKKIRAYGIEDMSEDADCSVRTIYRIFEGKHIPSMTLMLRICENLGMTVAIDERSDINRIFD